MPNLSARIEDFVEGDAFTIQRTIKRTASGLATGITATKAWFTVKEALTDEDVAALVQKEITTGDVPGTGQIENDGTGDVNIVLRFDILTADTRAISTTERYYDVQVLLSDSTLTTPEVGVIVAVDEVTLTDA